MKNFEARWFQSVSGRYLSLDESDASVTKFQADSREDAECYAREMEVSDSEIPFDERVLISEV